MVRAQNIFPLCLFFICMLTSQLFCEDRFAINSKLVTQAMENSSLAIFDRKGKSVIHCATLCLEEHCCKEFMYNKSSKQCLGLQSNDFNQTTSINLPSGNTGISLYQKGCQTGWLEFEGHCYHKGQTKVQWSEAKNECKKMCSYVIEIESKKESEWISNTFLEKDQCPTYLFSDCTAWTGLNDLNIEGTYIWDHSNAPLTFTNWHYGEPSLLNATEGQTRDCIDMLRGGVWNDRPCSHLNSVVCEKTLGH